MTAKHVAVLKGGLSAERPVSLVSGSECATALRKAGYRVSEIDVGHDIAVVLTEMKPDVVFNALHGKYGEDGCMQGVLETLRLPYTHSGVLASALAMHKERAKAVMRTAGIPVAEGLVVHRKLASERHLMEPPYVIKPVSEGSSIGVFIIREGDNRPPGELGTDSWTLGEEVLIEKFIPGRELTVAVMGERALAVTEITTAAAFYDYDAKYAAGGSTHVIPARVHPDVYEEAKRLAVLAHQAIGCRGVTRTDFRYDDTKGEPGRLVTIEINTQPGMTPTSLVPEQAAHVGLTFSDLVAWLVEDASCER
ncbi:MAG: D-alanine--D-alanine ligase [Alphaproteobacteria bacterium]|nr:D-alanine--D-alanine ligase [Alphaproteobacteria bacterium]